MAWVKKKFSELQGGDLFRFLESEESKHGLYMKLGEQAARAARATLVCIICPEPGQDDKWVQAGEFSDTSFFTVVEQLVEE